MASTTGRGTLGFTIIELMVALVLGSMVLLAVHAVIGMMVDTTLRNPTEDRAHEALRAESVRSSIREWLEGAYVAGSADDARFEGRDLERAGRPTDELMFTTLDRGTSVGDPSDVPVRVRIRVAEPPGGLIAEFHRPGEAPFRTVSLDPRAYGLDIHYLASARDSVWTDSWAPQHRLPHLVQIRFLAAPGEDLSPVFQLPMHIALADGAMRAPLTLDSVRMDEPRVEEQQPTPDEPARERRERRRERRTGRRQ